MTDIAPDHIPRRQPGLSLRYVETGAVIVGDDGVEVVSVDDTAAALWQLCDGETDVEEITEAVCTVWDVDRQVAHTDVCQTLTMLRDAGALSWADRP